MLKEWKIWKYIKREIKWNTMQYIIVLNKWKYKFIHNPKWVF